MCPVGRTMLVILEQDHIGVEERFYRFEGGEVRPIRSGAGLAGAGLGALCTGTLLSIRIGDSIETMSAFDMSPGICLD